MRSLFRLALFFSICFALTVAGAGTFRFLALRLDWLRAMNTQPEYIIPEIIAALRWALLLALYGCLPLGLSYAARKQIFAPPVALCLIVLALGLSAAVSLGLQKGEGIASAAVPPRQLGGPGLILTNAPGPNETSIILLAAAAERGGPRVAAVPGRPLLYQAEPVGPDGAAAAVPPLPFPDETPWLLQSIAIDLRLSAEQMRQRLDGGLLPFLLYTGALVFFLCSLGFIFDVSGWPLANLLLGFLASRGVLALETWCNSPETQDLFRSFAAGRFPFLASVPLLFFVAGLFLYLYAMLVYSVKRQRGNETQS